MPNFTLKINFLAALLAFCASVFAAPAETPKPASNSANDLVEWKSVLPKADAKSAGKTPALPRIMVPRGAKNLAAGKIVTSSSGISSENLKSLTDGRKEAVQSLDKGLHWVQIDLTQPCQIYAVHLWHSFAAPSVYKDVVIQVSNDAKFKKGAIITLFNNSRDEKSRFGVGPNDPYIESRNGLLVDCSGLDKLGVIGRYVRFWSNGNQIDEWNRYLEIEVIGSDNFAPVKFSLPSAPYVAARRKDSPHHFVLPPESYS